MTPAGPEIRSWLHVARAHADIPVLFLVALAIRLWRLDLTQFHFDDGVAMIFGEQILGGGWNQVGLKTTFGFYNPPLFVYLVALFMLVSRNPLVVAGIVAALNAGGVALTARIARRWWGVTAGWAAGALMAFSPCAIAASRRVYAQDIVPPLAALILYFAARWMTEGRRRDAFWTVFLGLCLTQIHYSGITIVAALSLAWLLIRPPTSWRAAGAGAALGLTLSAPYVAHLFSTGFEDARIALSLLGQGDARAHAGRWAAWAYAFNLAGDADLRFILADAYDAAQRAAPAYAAVRLGVNALAAAALIFCVRDAFRRQATFVPSPLAHPPARARLIACWALVPPALYSLAGLHAVPSYLFVAMPIPFLLLGWALSRIAGNPPARWKGWMTPAALGIWAAWQSMFWLAAIRAAGGAGAGAAPYVPYRDQAAVCAFIAENLVPGATQINQNDWPPERGVGYNYLYLIHWLRGGRTREPLFAGEIPLPRAHIRILELPYVAPRSLAMMREGFGPDARMWRSGAVLALCRFDEWPR